MILVFNDTYMHTKGHTFQKYSNSNLSNEHSNHQNSDKNKSESIFFLNEYTFIYIDLIRNQRLSRYNLTMLL